MLSFVPHALLYLDKSHVDLGEACSGTCRVLSDYKFEDTVKHLRKTAYSVVETNSCPENGICQDQPRRRPTQPSLFRSISKKHCTASFGSQAALIGINSAESACQPQVKPPRLHGCLVTPLRLAVSFVAGSLSGCHSSKRGSGWP